MGSMNRLLEQLRRSVLPAPLGQPADGQLLECFIARRDEVAFAALVRRHGPMVLGVCRRIIGNAHDADDAFQATFLVLARKARSVWPRQAVGNWLHGVAYRTALRVRGRVSRHRAREVALLELPQAAKEAEKFSPEEHELLHRELGRLSDKYRLPVVLCELEGRSRREVAGQLNIPEGTLSSRLAAARRLLAKRLSRRGVALSAGAGAALLASCKASAAVPEVLIFSTIRAAILVAAGSAAAAGLVSAPVAALTEGVLKTMFVAKLKFTAAVAIGVVALGLGTGGFLYQTQVYGQEQGGSNPAGPRPADDRAKANASRDLERAQKEIQALRDQLEQARQETLEIKKHAEQMAKQMEEQHARVEEARHQAEVQMRRAQQMAEMQAKQAHDAGLAARREMELRNTAQSSQQTNAGYPPGLQQGQLNIDGELKRLQETREAIRARAEQQRKELQARLADLDEQQKRLEEAVEQSRNRNTQPRNSNPQSAPSGDKLDRILEKLDQLDRRVQRLEQRRQED